MCRMIAFASAATRDAATCLERLARFCERGNLVAGWEKHPGGNHPDGWGAAWRQDGELRGVRSGMPAASDRMLSELRVRTDRFIGHVRYASNPETVQAENSHPFLAAGIALAHNGTFYGKIGEEADGRRVSDSLVFLELLARRWKERTLEGLADVLEEMLSDRELVGDYSAANLLVAAGERLFAFRKHRRNPEYYTLYLSEPEGCRVVASQPPDEGTGWSSLKDGELIDLVDGRRRLVLPPRGA
ncbi:MAG: class II glutamine amidotransferase [Thermodesulfobacteriota bacterium]